MKTIWLDVDGVLLDYTNPFLRFAGLDASYQTLLDYDLNKLMTDGRDLASVMVSFALSREFANLPAIAKREDLELLKNMGYTLKAITQLAAPPRARLSRIRNLTQKFGAVFDEIVFTVPGQSKLKYISKLRSNSKTILVEDNPELLKEANYYHKIGVGNIEVIGIRHPYNAAVVDDPNYYLTTYNSFANFTYNFAMQDLYEKHGDGWAHE